MRRRIVVTGLGCVNAFGSDASAFWNSLKEGKSGVGLTTLFDTSTFPTKISAEISNWSMAAVGEDAQRWAPVTRQTQFAAAAAKRAMQAAGLLDHNLDPRRLGVYLGCGDAYQDFNQFVQLVADSTDGDLFDVSEFVRAGLKLLRPDIELQLQPHMAGMYLAGMFNAQGPASSCFTACAASTQAIGEAAELVRRGDADAMIAGGAHSLIHPFGFTGLNLLTALSTKNLCPASASRPFDRDRDGFVMGEGAAMVVVEEYEHAVARGADILAEISGYGVSADAYRVTDSHPDARGAIRCMHMALDDAKLSADAIGYINAHGTSTLMNDRMETLAIKRVFGASAYSTPISSTKSMTGHLLAAAGATEVVVCLLALNDGVVPPTINYEHPDHECDLDYVPNEARDVRCQHILTNSFGFGGQNAALILSSPRAA